jgi:hypothetical protein
VNQLSLLSGDLICSTFYIGYRHEPKFISHIGIDRLGGIESVVVVVVISQIS